MLFDDIGSYPLPRGVDRRWVESAVTDRYNDAKLFSIIQDAMQQKMNAGVEVPNYPQFQDINGQLLRIINNHSNWEEPFLIKEDKARLIELEALESLAKDYYNDVNAKLAIRLCVNGPIELYTHQYGGTTDNGVLINLAKSVNRFITNSIKTSSYMNIRTVSIDEPSLGVNPLIRFADGDVANALNEASKGLNGVDIEVHLHSPIYYKTICDVPGISIIGVEYAADSSNLKVIEKNYLEKSDKFLRVGIARTDIDRMAAEIYEKTKNQPEGPVNVWEDRVKLSMITNTIETSENIKQRLEKAYSEFGELIKYAGADCGLSSWPDQGLAYNLLKNTGIAIREFRKSTRI